MIIDFGPYLAHRRAQRRPPAKAGAQAVICAAALVMLGLIWAVRR